MAEKFLDDIDEDLDDSMGDILEDSIEDFSDETLEKEMDEYMDDPDDSKKESPVKQLLQKITGLPKKVLSSKKRIIIAAAVLLALLLLIAGAVMFLSGGEDEAASDEAQSTTRVEGTIPQEPEILFEDIVDLEPFERIALKSSSSMRLVSITLSLELTDHRYRKQVYTMEDRIRRIVTDQVAEMTWLELRNPEGKIMLKYSLLKRINSIFPKATVRNIYFTYFVMQ